jgi:hypothetical protein
LVDDSVVLVVVFMVFLVSCLLAVGVGAAVVVIAVVVVVVTRGVVVVVVVVTPDDEIVVDIAGDLDEEHDDDDEVDSSDASPQQLVRGTNGAAWTFHLSDMVRLCSLLGVVVFPWKIRPAPTVPVYNYTRHFTRRSIGIPGNSIDLVDFL